MLRVFFKNTLYFCRMISLLKSCFVALTVFYCLALSSNKVAKEQLNSLYSSSPTQSDLFKSHSSKFLCNTAQASTAVISYTNAPVPSIKNLNKDLCVVFPHLNALVYQAAFSQYSKRFQNFCINQRKEELIFPFHVFW